MLQAVSGLHSRAQHEPSGDHNVPPERTILSGSGRSSATRTQSSTSERCVHSTGPRADPQSGAARRRPAQAQRAQAEAASADAWAARASGVATAAGQASGGPPRETPTTPCRWLALSYDPSALRGCPRWRLGPAKSPPVVPSLGCFSLSGRSLRNALLLKPRGTHAPSPARGVSSPLGKDTSIV